MEFLFFMFFNLYIFVKLGFSKNLGTLWEDLGKVMEGEDEIEIGEVDCAVSKPVCSKVDIHSYPKFKVFYDGEEVAKYQGKVHIFLSLLDGYCILFSLFSCVAVIMFVDIHRLCYSNAFEIPT